LNRRNVFLFFVLPFVGVFVFFSLAAFLQHRGLKVRTESLVRGQLGATAGILSAAVSRFLDEGLAPEAVLDTILAGEEVYFVALLDADRNVLAWNSRFEGYLPLSLAEAGDKTAGIIDSPAGKIFSDLTGLRTADGRRYYLYLGYALRGMEDMIALSRRTSFFLSGLFLLVGALFFRVLYRLQSGYLAKSREAEAERMEKERFREISAFTSGIAHEIKNPLNSLALALELLGRKAPAEARGDIDLGKAQVRTISRVVDRFSSAVRAVQPEIEPLELDEVLRLAAGNLAAEAPEASSRVRLESAPGVRLAGDRELLAQALLNILKNAVEASADASISVGGQRSGHRVEVRVRDAGPGLPPDAEARLFEPFYTTKEKGMGIGLYLAKKIVEAHGGKIAVGRPKGGGTEFRIDLPGA
jgi:signal transduction histidine kinase